MFRDNNFLKQISAKQQGITLTQEIRTQKEEQKNIVSSVTALTIEELETLKERITKIIQEKHSDDVLDKNGRFDRQKLEIIIPGIINKTMSLNLMPQDKERLICEVINDLVSFGPITPLIENPDVSEIMVNGPDAVFAEIKGKLIKTDIIFPKGKKQIKQIIDKIVQPIGRQCDESNPLVDARLPDGSRVNATVPPISKSPTLTIRKFFKEKLGPEDLVRFGSIHPLMLHFLKAAVYSRLNIVVSGGTGSGKTTCLNLLSNFIPDGERIVSIEDAYELQLHHDHWVPMEAKPPNIEGKGAVTIRDLVKNSLRMRPDRVIIGECRSGEALDMLQAMNTGHDGSLTTLHANSPKDAISRLETMVLMAGMELPTKAIREQIASAVDLIVQVKRLRDGSRKIVAITHVVGMGIEAAEKLGISKDKINKEQVYLQDVFRYEITGFMPKKEGEKSGKIIGHFVSTGYKPEELIEKIVVENDFQLPEIMFKAGILPDDYQL